jgi:hypothetical protein
VPLTALESKKSAGKNFSIPKAYRQRTASTRKVVELLSYLHFADGS